MKRLFERYAYQTRRGTEAGADMVLDEAMKILQSKPTNLRELQAEGRGDTFFDCIPGGPATAANAWLEDMHDLGLIGDVKELRPRLAAEFTRIREEALNWPADDEDDRPLPEDEAIAAAFPTRSGKHATYAQAMRLVGAKRSKGALVALVNWLLIRIEKRT